MSEQRESESGFKAELGCDEKCLELADYFLAENPAAYPLLRNELADAIQQAVEDFFDKIEES